MPWNRKTTRKSRHKRNRARTTRELRADRRARDRVTAYALKRYGEIAKRFTFREMPWMWFLQRTASPVDTPPPAVP